MPEHNVGPDTYGREVVLRSYADGSWDVIALNPNPDGWSPIVGLTSANIRAMAAVVENEDAKKFQREGLWPSEVVAREEKER